MNILCPICRNKLSRLDKQYKCLNNHSFDIAKEGYINLNMKSSIKTGDEKEMINARTSFLNNGYYSFLKEKINEVLNKLGGNTLVDLASGEGYYTSYFNVKEKLGVELSKEGVKYASKHDKTSTYILRNIFDLPLEDNSVDLVTTIFAPISNEISRVLKNGGYFILVKPDIYHLYELKSAVYDSPYLNEVEETTIEGLSLVDEIKISDRKEVKNTDLINLFKMTPYYHKTSKDDFNKLLNIESLQITFSFIIDIYKKD